MVNRPTETQLLENLHTLPFFQDLDLGTTAVLAAQTRWQTYQTGEVIFWEGESAAGLYLMHAGWLKVVKTTPSGREQVLRFFGPGEMFNEIGALANQPNPATAVALEPVGLWLLPRQIMVQLMAERPLFAQHLIQQLAGRVIHLVGLVADLSLRPVVGRLASLLLTGATDDILHRPRWYTQAELASRLGTVPDVIQRALRQLEDSGAIAVERHHIRVLDREKLAEIAAQ